ncbi:hypothetical protein Scep_013317 [Stephania cephalantha]|uniref:Gag-pol polyprotein n=1 Tax=Stephania cephalantha TaxID=152367 RepID=A0AAP0JH88_9MAGN
MEFWSRRRNAVMHDFLGNDPVKRGEIAHSNESIEERLKRFARGEDVVDGVDVTLRLAPPQPQPQPLVVVQPMLLAPKQPPSTQRHQIFRTSCTIKHKLCSVIIDSGSSKNIVAKSLVMELALESTPHPSPCKVSWINQSHETKISEQCKVPLSIGKLYHDVILCDVVDMDVCHVVLGRPWQYDVKAVHKGDDNIYYFKWNSRRITLMPLPAALRYNLASPAPQPSM